MKYKTKLAVLLLVAIAILTFSCNQSGKESQVAQTGGGNQIPKSDPEFKGKIATAVDESTADFPMPLKCPR